MIVLDEQISRASLRDAFKWYPGRVAFLKELRPGTLVDDDAVPTILRGTHEPTFVTINLNHFWRVSEPDRHYCIICLPLSPQQAEEVPGILRRLFRLPDFSSRALRMGTVLHVASERILCYRIGDRTIRSIPLE